jgi:hypothetical protein
MRALLIPDLAIALPHLLEVKAEVLDCTLCGQLYRPRLVAQLGAIEALPPVGPTGRPLAEALDEAELLSDTITLLQDLRDAIAEELGTDLAALHQVDTDLFAFIDTLAEDREASARQRAAATTTVLPVLAARDAASPFE